MISRQKSFFNRERGKRNSSHDSSIASAFQSNKWAITSIYIQIKTAAGTSKGLLQTMSTLSRVKEANNNLHQELEAKFLLKNSKKQWLAS